MPRGGPRPGSGRKKGSTDRATRIRRHNVELAAEAISKEIAGQGVLPFTGDAHAYLMSIYKDTSIPMPFRLDAAKASIPYEKPRLASVTIIPEDQRPPVIDRVEYEIIDAENVIAEGIELELEDQLARNEPTQLEFVSTEPAPAAKQHERVSDPAPEDEGTEGIPSTFTGII